MRATGDNPQMIRALGVDTGNMIVLGLAISNGLVALSGALLAQYQGFADVQMGIGMIVLGLASVILGQAHHDQPVALQRPKVMPECGAIHDHRCSELAHRDRFRAVGALEFGQDCKLGGFDSGRGERRIVELRYPA